MMDVNPSVRGSTPSPWKPYTKPFGGNSNEVSTDKPSFRQFFEQAVTDRSTKPWNISQHAQQRLNQRQITLTPTDLAAMTQAATKAQNKGAKNAYMVLGNTGLVVNLPSRTVVTAMDHQSDTIITQIDSVVFVKKPDHMGGSLPIGDR